MIRPGQTAGSLTVSRGLGTAAARRGHSPIGLLYSAGCLITILPQFRAVSPMSFTLRRDHRAMIRPRPAS